MAKLERLVQSDAKNRYNLLFETPSDSSEGVWWIRANQGHSLKVCIFSGFDQSSQEMTQKSGCRAGAH